VNSPTTSTVPVGKDSLEGIKNGINEQSTVVEKRMPLKVSYADVVKGAGVSGTGGGCRLKDSVQLF
jgi:hypothetical protein